MTARPNLRPWRTGLALLASLVVLAAARRCSGQTPSAWRLQGLGSPPQLAPTPDDRRQSGDADGSDPGAKDGTREGKEGGGDREKEEKEREKEKPPLPAPFGDVMEALNPARIQQFLCHDDEPERRSDKPRAPEIPLAVFREVVRPLGALKYENQFNYFEGAFTGKAPNLQTQSFEYVFADWNAARFELAYPNGQLEAIAVGYQRTLGVGERHNWAHGVIAIPEFSVKENFVGFLGFYTFAWKPTEESPWSAGLSAGATRSSFAGVSPGGAALAGGMGGMGMAGQAGDERTGGKEASAAAWRPFLSANLWYTFSRSFTVGVENDAFPHNRFGEYLVLPNLTWQPTEHFFVQAGAGYYYLRGESQATFMVRANLLNASPRKPRKDPGEGER